MQLRWQRGVRSGIWRSQGARIPFHPLRTAPYAWWHADFTTGTTPVTVALDQSGNGRDLVPLAGGQEPTTALDANFNNKRCFVFTNGKRLLTSVNHTIGQFSVVFNAAGWGDSTTAFSFFSDCAVLRFSSKCYTRRYTGVAAVNSGKVSVNNVLATRQNWGFSAGPTHATCIQYLDGTTNNTTSEVSGDPGNNTKTAKLVVSGIEANLTSSAGGIKFRHMFFWNRAISQTELIAMHDWMNKELLS